MATNMKLFSDLFSWRRTTTIQKIILFGGVMFSISFITGFWSVWIIYLLALPVSWKLTQLTLKRHYPVPTDKVLLAMQAINRVKHSILSMGHTQRDVRPTFQNKFLKDMSLGDDLDIGRAKDVSTLRGQTVDGEVRIFVKYVVRDFVQSWYEDFSHDTQTLKESQQILHNVAENLTKRGQKINPQRLTTDLVHLYNQHLYTFQIAKLIFQSKRRGSSDPSLTKCETFDDTFADKIGFHPALKNKESEMNFLRSLSKLMLAHILPANIDNCQSTLVMMTEIVACNVLKSAIDMLTDPDWLYESMIILMSDDEPLHTSSSTEVPDTAAKPSTELPPTAAMAHQKQEVILEVSDDGISKESKVMENSPKLILLNIPVIRLENVDIVCDSAGSDKNTQGTYEDGVKNEDTKTDCDKEEKKKEYPLENCEKLKNYSVTENEKQEKKSPLDYCEKLKEDSSTEKEKQEKECECPPENSYKLKGDSSVKDEDKTSIATESSNSAQANQNVLDSSSLSNHVLKADTISSSSDKPKRTSSSSTLFSLFRRKGSKADSTKSTRNDSVTSTSSDQYFRPRGETCEEDNEDFTEISTKGNMESTLGVECSEEAVPLRGESVVQFFVNGDDAKSEDGSTSGKDIDSDFICDDSSLFFQDVSVPESEERNEYRSSSKYILYSIEYNALYFSDGPPVLKSGNVKRRFREFVNLQSRLENNSSYKKLLKDIKGPSRWNTLPFKNLDKESIETRRLFLEKYIKALIQIEAICNGPELREFLAYEGDGHIAFVKKAPEMSVPRLDKMLARTVSGVFEKIMAIPDIPQNVLSAVTKRDRSVERLDITKPTEDTDKLNLEFSWHDLDSDTEATVWIKNIEEFISTSEKYSDDDDNVSMTTGIDKIEKQALLEEIHSRLPRSQGDGSETPEGLVNESEGQVIHDLPIANAVLDLALQTIQGHEHWLTREKVMAVTRIVVGKALDRWLSDKITYLTTPERWVYYSQLLREAIWPDGELSSDEKPVKPQSERDATRSKAKQTLMDFFPGFIRQLVGEEDYERAADQVMESLENKKLNKHFLYMFLEILTEKLFPEITAQELQEKLFT